MRVSIFVCVWKKKQSKVVLNHKLLLQPHKLPRESSIFGLFFQLNEIINARGKNGGDLPPPWSPLPWCLAMKLQGCSGVEISVLEWGKLQRSQRPGRVGVTGTGECFHFARAVGGTLMRAVTLFNKMPRKARGQEEGARERRSGWGWQETVMRWKCPFVHSFAPSPLSALFNVKQCEWLVGLVSVSNYGVFFPCSPELQPDEFTAWEWLKSSAGGPAGILFTRTLSWTFFQVFLWGKSLSGNVSFLPCHPQLLDHPRSRDCLSYATTETSVSITPWTLSTWQCGPCALNRHLGNLVSL